MFPAVRNASQRSLGRVGQASSRAARAGAGARRTRAVATLAGTAGKLFKAGVPLLATATATAATAHASAANVTAATEQGKDSSINVPLNEYDRLKFAEQNKIVFYQYTTCPFCNKVSEAAQDRNTNSNSSSSSSTTDVQ